MRQLRAEPIAAALLVLVILIASSAWADCPHPKPKGHVRREAPKAPAPTLLEQITSRLALTAGLRWDREMACPSYPPTAPPACGDPAPAPRPRHHKMHDPAFIGLELPIELRPGLELHTAGDFDVEGPNRGRIGSARILVAWQPWARKR